MTHTIPACLSRGAADDRAEARTRLEAQWGQGLSFDTALAAVLSQQADQVCDAARPVTALNDRIGDLAYSVAGYASARCADDPGDPFPWSLSQRADVLAAARLLCKVALEVSA